MTTHATWSTPARGLIVAAAFVVVLAGMQGAAPLLGPIPVSYTHLTLPTNREV